jgi:hypothetical protein
MFFSISTRSAAWLRGILAGSVENGRRSLRTGCRCRFAGLGRVQLVQSRVPADEARQQSESHPAGDRRADTLLRSAERNDGRVSASRSDDRHTLRHFYRHAATRRQDGHGRVFRGRLAAPQDRDRARRSRRHLFRLAARKRSKPAALPGPQAARSRRCRHFLRTRRARHRSARPIAGAA